jgi:ABC-type multidrug transport system fused ATPase/permease subunit
MLAAEAAKPAEAIEWTRRNPWWNVSARLSHGAAIGYTPPAFMSPPSRKQYFRRFLAYALDYKALLAVAIFMGVLKFAMNYTFPWLIGSAVDTIAPKLVEGAPPPPPIDQRMSWLWTLIGLGVVFSVFHSIGTFGRGYYAAKLGNRIIADIRQDLFDHLHRLSLHFYSKERTGSIVSRLINDIQQASQIVNGGFVAVAMDLFSLSVGIVLLISVSWKLTLACMIIWPLYGITFKLLNPRVREASKRVQHQISKISGNVQERLAGIALVKTYAAEAREKEQFEIDTEEHYDRVLEQSNLSQTVAAISEGLVHFGQTIVIGFGGYMALTGRISAGEVVKFMGWLAVMYLPVRRFAEVNVVYQTSLAAIERVFQVFDITPKIVEKPQAVTAPPERGEVRFEQVVFDYVDDSDESRVSLEEELPPEEKEQLTEAAELRALERARLIASGKPPEQRRRPVLDGLSLSVSAGERVALVGPSGSGKTTLVSLLPRLYDVSGGRITIDGTDLRDFKLRALRRAIGIVQQDSFLFSGSLRDNLAYGRPDATDEHVVAAAKAANAHEFITALPDGYDAKLGERGVNLSGGQRQRLSIARAILKDPRILILDEATSALDSESEALVQEALDRLMRGRTCFIIAHRLSTVRNVDRILVLRDGRVIETGRHDELLALGGLYARLVRQQFGPTLKAG